MKTIECKVNPFVNGVTAKKLMDILYLTDNDQWMVYIQNIDGTFSPISHVCLDTQEVILVAGKT